MTEQEKEQITKRESKLVRSATQDQHLCETDVAVEDLVFTQVRDETFEEKDRAHTVNEETKQELFVTRENIDDKSNDCMVFHHSDSDKNRALEFA